MGPSPSESPLKKPTVYSAFPHLSPDETPQLKDIARLIRDGKAKRVLVMAGAGISTSAGIPDFRSPGTGLYDNLAKYDLPYPEAIFDIDYLSERPEAFYTLAKELYPGNFKPTTTHYFFKLLQDKGLLKGVWTQNIDTLERIAGIEDDFIVEAHGSFASAECLNCGKDYSQEEIKPRIMEGEVVRCLESRCKGRKDALIKPRIVFFGEGLPDRFFSRISHFSSCDLLIVLGTSLTVGPFNSLLHRVPSTCPRLLINLEKVGQADFPGDKGFEFEKKGGRDVSWLGQVDEGVEALCRLVGEGWGGELEKLRRQGWARLDAEATAQETEDEDEEEVGEKQAEVVEAVGEALHSRTGEQLQEGRASRAEPARKEGEVVVEKAVDELTKAVQRVELDGEKVVEKGTL
ncbi:hypothetical protein JCM11641_001134 [Rhodosporidiobolus odoratus]